MKKFVALFVLTLLFSFAFVACENLPSTDGIKDSTSTDSSSADKTDTTIIEDNGNILEPDSTTGTDEPITGEESKPSQEMSPTEEIEYILVDGKNEYYVKSIRTLTSAEIVIATTYNGLPVTSIGSRAFKNCTGLKRVSITNGQ